MKYFVVSDVHGFFTPLISTLNSNNFDEDNPEHKLIVCGDLMDRGNEAYELQEYILRLLEKNRVILIRGNHEDLVLEMLGNYESKYAPNNSIAYSHHYYNRTIHTMLDLTGMDFYEALFNPSAFVDKAYKTPFIKDIIPKTINYFETDNYIFVHGWIPCAFDNMPNHYKIGRKYNYNPKWRLAAESDWERARWLNGMDCAMMYNIIEPNKTIICGHWHCSYGHENFESGSKNDYSPFKSEGIIAIDACTARSGKVNCLVIED